MPRLFASAPSAPEPVRERPPNLARIDDLATPRQHQEYHETQEAEQEQRRSFSKARLLELSLPRPSSLSKRSRGVSAPAGTRDCEIPRRMSREERAPDSARLADLAQPRQVPRDKEKPKRRKKRRSKLRLLALVQSKQDSAGNLGDGEAGVAGGSCEEPGEREGEADEAEEEDSEEDEPSDAQTCPADHGDSIPDAMFTAPVEGKSFGRAPLPLHSGGCDTALSETITAPQMASACIAEAVDHVQANAGPDAQKALFTAPAEGKAFGRPPLPPRSGGYATPAATAVTAFTSALSFAAAVEAPNTSTMASKAAIKLGTTGGYSFTDRVSCEGNAQRRSRLPAGLVRAAAAAASLSKSEPAFKAVPIKLFELGI